MAMYQPAIETMPQDQLRALQSERLVKQVKHVWDNVPYYRQKMEAKGVTPEDIQSIFSAILGHRIVLGNEARYTKKTETEILAAVLEETPVPPAKEKLYENVRK